MLSEPVTRLEDYLTNQYIVDSLMDPRCAKK